MAPTAVSDVGDVTRLTVAFVDLASVATDPTTVTFVMRAPDGTTTTYVYGTDSELVKDSVGNYHVDWTIAQELRHHYEFNGTGTVIASFPGEFYARRRDVA